jgi:hypothetical protein
MTQELHPKAAEAFNANAEEIFRGLELSPEYSTPTGFRPDAYASAHLTRADVIGPIKMKQNVVDAAGKKVGRIIGKSSRLLLSGESYANLLNLLQQLQKRTNLKLVATDKLLDLAFEWMEHKLDNTVISPFVDFLLTASDKLVEDMELWLPLYRTYIELPISFGDVTFQAITREMLDGYERKLLAHNTQNIESIKQSIAQKRKLFQATAAARIKVTAERDKASQIAHEKAEAAVCLLRFLSPANIDPEMRSYCTLLGAEGRILAYDIRVNNEQIHSISQSIFEQRNSDWILKQSDLDNSKSLIENLQLVAGNARSPFQQALYEALLLYSRNSISSDPADKLVYILVSLEFLLLRDSNEPISKNIGERMAFIVGLDFGQRKKIVDNVTATYKLRSAFIHHGQTIEDMKTLQDFMVIAWTCFSNLLGTQHQFRTKDDLLDALERAKLS